MARSEVVDALFEPIENQVGTFNPSLVADLLREREEVHGVELQWLADLIEGLADRIHQLDPADRY